MLTLQSKGRRELLDGQGHIFIRVRNNWFITKLYKLTSPRGFAVEILEVYLGPAVILYKFKNWGFIESPFKGMLLLGKCGFFGMAIFKVSPLDLYL